MDYHILRYRSSTDNIRRELTIETRVDASTGFFSMFLVTRLLFRVVDVRLMHFNKNSIYKKMDI
ncbi:hypothetical protein BpHYR1_040233 [Brachionus plicatilis]|uniref:Uncharacterized protein n=1 Tax=Brachionus plicatilis TaxID=10195 RepID=A0A3M7S1U0_BRAPC|nr:hypothetical protein BpHYR1_040233 [Brachionus plicatilis]